MFRVQTCLVTAIVAILFISSSSCLESNNQPLKINDSVYLLLINDVDSDYQGFNDSLLFNFTDSNSTDDYDYLANSSSLIQLNNAYFLQNPPNQGERKLSLVEKFLICLNLVMLAITAVYILGISLDAWQSAMREINSQLAIIRQARNLINNRENPSIEIIMPSNPKLMPPPPHDNDEEENSDIFMNNYDLLRNQTLSNLNIREYDYNHEMEEEDSTQTFTSFSVFNEEENID